MFNDAHLVAYSPYAKFEHVESFDLLFFFLEKQRPVGVALPKPYPYEVSNAYPGT